MSSNRVPIVFGPIAGPGAALLREGRGADAPEVAWFQPATASRHAAGCACCAGRSPAALALTALLHARARGTVPFFTRVVIDAGTAGRAEVRDAVARDPLVSQTFQLQEDRPT